MRDGDDPVQAELLEAGAQAGRRRLRGEAAAPVAAAEAVAELNVRAAELERLQIAIPDDLAVALSLATERLKPRSAWVAMCRSTISRVPSIEAESGPRKYGQSSA